MVNILLILNDGDKKMEQLKKHIIELEVQEAVERTKHLLDEGNSPEHILKTGLVPSMDEVGDLFQKGEYFIPELLMAARAMEHCVALLKPLLVKGGIEPLGKVILGSVKGDMHDIGKNLVGIIFESAGFEVVDLGVDVTAEKYVNAIKEHNPIAIGMSALLTSTMLEMKEILDAIKSAGLRDQIKVIIGGAPVNDDYADEIGADFYGDDPQSAKNFVQQFI